MNRFNLLDYGRFFIPTDPTLRKLWWPKNKRGRKMKRRVYKKMLRRNRERMEHVAGRIAATFERHANHVVLQILNGLPGYNQD